MEAVTDNLITIDPEIMSGTPVFHGTRVPVQSLFDWLETETLDEFLDNFPSVSREQAITVMAVSFPVPEGDKDNSLGWSERSECNPR